MHAPPSQGWLDELKENRPVVFFRITLSAQMEGIHVKIMRRTLLHSLAGLLLVPAVQAYEPDQAANNLAHDFAQCAAYYTFVSKGVGPKYAQQAKEAESLTDLALQGSIELSNPKVTKARYEMAVKSMASDMDNDFKNFSVVINEYSDLCVEVMNNPEARFKYWSDKEG
ncbi:MAG: hypothetical protein WCC29_02240 [Pseudomonas farsensis]|uniref:hypothetical protein n=1 Tax=Pseudomonas farsensis TaxID=2745492 RepID=UPI003C7C787F